jgi:hypothetical protein
MHQVHEGRRRSPRACWTMQTSWLRRCAPPRRPRCPRRRRAWPCGVLLGHGIGLLVLCAPRVELCLIRQQVDAATAKAESSSSNNNSNRGTSHCPWTSTLALLLRVDDRFSCRVLAGDNCRIWQPLETFSWRNDGGAHGLLSPFCACAEGSTLMDFIIISPLVH